MKYKDTGLGEGEGGRHDHHLVPCQDTPSVKVPYTAHITVPSPLTALTSALREVHPLQLQGGLTQYKFSASTNPVLPHSHNSGPVGQREGGAQSPCVGWAVGACQD